MSSNGSSPPTNGASLEDCRTNVFALTELNGLKWKRFVPATSRGVTDIDQEPVLSAYGRCLAEGMLCVWRRTPGMHSTTPATAGPTSSGAGGGIWAVDLRMDTPKELWVFWYSQDEPPALAHCTHLLPVNEEGSWQNPGIAYEIRILLFRALHNLIERNLLKDGYVRFGKWFTRPLERSSTGAEHCTPGFMTALNFSFFVHGDSVCMTVNVQRQPPLYKVTKRHLNPDGRSQTIILAPWSFRANLLADQPLMQQGGVHQHHHTATINRLWNEWKDFHPLVPDNEEDVKENMGYVDEAETELQERARAAALPKMLLIELNGVRMYYPSCYIAVLADEDANIRRTVKANNSDQSNLPTTSKQPQQMQQQQQPTPVKRRLEQGKDNERRSVLHSRLVNGVRAVQRAVEETCLTTMTIGRRRASQSPAHELLNNVGEDDQRWNIVDCTRREKCPCKNCNGNSSENSTPSTSAVTTPTIMSKGAHKFAPPMPFGKHSKAARSTFHRRSPLTVMTASMSSPALLDEATTSASATPLTTSIPSLAPPMAKQFPPISVQPALNQAMASQLVGPSNPSVYQNISPVPPSRTQSPQVEFNSVGMNERKPSPYVDSSNVADGKFFPPSRGASHGGLPSIRAPLTTANVSATTTIRLTASYGDVRQQKQQQNRRVKWPRIAHLDPTFVSMENGEQSAFPLDQNANDEDGICFFAASTSSAEATRDDEQRLFTETNEYREIKNEPMDDSSYNSAQSTSSSFHRDDMLTRLLSEDDDSPSTMPCSSSFQRQPPISNSQPMLTTSYYTSNLDTLPSAAMPENFMDTSPSVAHNADSVHLSPPASLERHEPAHSSSVNPMGNPTYALLQRGPASVGGIEYSQIYPTPPSVDPSQPQQFSPPSALMVAQKNAALAAAMAVAVTAPIVEPVVVASAMINTEPVPIEEVDNDLTPLIYNWSRLCAYPLSKKYFDEHRIFGRSALPTPPEYKQSSGFALSKQNSFNANVAMSFGMSHHHQHHHPHHPPMHHQQHSMQPQPYFPTSSQQQMMPMNTQIGYGNMMGMRPTSTMRQSPMMYQPGGGQMVQQMAPPMMIPHPPPNYGACGGGGGMVMMPSTSGMQMQQPIRHPTSSVQHLNEFVNNNPMFSSSSMHPQQPMPMNSNPFFNRPQMPMMSGQPPYLMEQHELSTQFMPAGPQQAGVGPGYGSQVGSPYGSPHHASPQMIRQLSQPRTPSGHMQMQQAIPSPYNQRPLSGVPSLPMQHGGGGGEMSMPPLRNLLPEGKSLVLAVLMQDTILDLHHDIIFDSCLICACNLDIRGAEIGIYLTPPEFLNRQMNFHIGQGSNKCTCGFSAVRHRLLSLQSGLFSDDVREAGSTSSTILLPPPQIPSIVWFDARITFDGGVLDLLRHQSLTRDLGALVGCMDTLRMQSQHVLKAKRIGLNPCDPGEYVVSEIDIKEVHAAFGGAMMAAIDAANTGFDMSRPIGNHFDKKHPVHQWGFQLANEISEAQEAECMAVLSQLQPLLDQTVNGFRNGGIPQKNSGAMANNGRYLDETMTWRVFDRKAFKSVNIQDEDCQPEPIPTIVMALERDAMTVSPQAVRFWERLTLGPFDQPKDVMYIAVVPDNNIIFERSKKFFDELSKLYESCRFGRHLRFVKQPVTRINNMRQTTAEFTYYNAIERHVDNKIAYHQQWVNELKDILAQNEAMFERSAYREAMRMESSNGHPSTSSALTSSTSSDLMPPPAMPQQLPQSIVPATSTIGLTSTGLCSSNSPQLMMMDPNNGGDPSTSAASPEGEHHQPDDDPSALPPVLVVYVVNPFLFGAESHNELLARVVTVGLLRAFNELLNSLPESRRPYVQLEIVSLQQIFDYTALMGEPNSDERGLVTEFDAGLPERRLNQRLTSWELLKTLAVSVYSQTRVVLHDVVRNIVPKPMTRFGPASSIGDILDELSKKPHPHVAFKVNCQPFVLSATHPLLLKATTEIVAPVSEESVLFVSYCLIGNEWLAAAVTDHRGHLLDNCLINLRPAPDQKSHRYRHRTQIWDALLRLWQFIGSVLSTGLKNWRLVVGRVGRIGHGEFRVWTHLMSKTNLRKQGAQLKQNCKTCGLMPGYNDTPALLSACLVSMEPEPRLRVFPNFLAPEDKFNKSNGGRSTSTNARSNSLKSPDDASCTHILVFPARSDITPDQPGHLGGDDIDMMNMDFLNADDEFNEFKDLDMGDIGLTSAALPSAGPNKSGNVFFGTDAPDIPINNQPLATGFYVSTAPAIDLPDWFWSPCPGAKRRMPVQLRSSLHLNTQNVQANDDVGTTGPSVCNTASHNHPLESDGSDEVLRYVLETYNALSWLNMDMVTGERRSCLPVHIQALLRLCNSVTKLIT